MTKKCRFKKKLEKTIFLMDSNLSGVEILKVISGIRSNSSILKENSIELFPTIAQILGEQRTSEELFPFYIHTTNLTETELVKMILKFAEIDYQNFDKNSIKTILNFVKELTEIDSNQIRNALSTLFEKIISNLSKETIPELIENYFIELVDSEYCPQQITCFTLISQVAEYLTMDFFEEIIKNFSNLESTEQAKASLINSTSEMIKYANNDEFTSKMEIYLNNLYENSQKNPLIYKSLLNLIKDNKKLSKNFVINIIDNLVSEFNELDFRVQIALIESFNYITFMSYNDKIMKLIQIKNATKNNVILVQICAELQSPVVQTLENNEIQTTTKLVESMIEEFVESSYVPLCVQALQEIKYLVPLIDRNFAITILSKYISSDNTDIYLAALGTISCECFTKEEQLPIIKNELQSRDWRGRHAIASNTHLMQDKSILEEMFFDDAYAVRMKAIQVAKEISDNDVDSNSWIKENIEPIVKELFNSKDYQMRQTALICVHHFGIDKFEEDILTEAAKDNVSNVRATAAKIAKELNINNIIQILKDDDDPIIQEILNP